MILLPEENVFLKFYQHQVKKVLTMAAAGAMAYTIKYAMTKEFNSKEAAQYMAANPNKK